MVCTVSVLQPVLKVLMMQRKLSFELVNRKENVCCNDVTLHSVLLGLSKLLNYFFTGKKNFKDQLRETHSPGIY